MSFDASYNAVSLLLPFDGANDSTSFPDLGPLVLSGTITGTVKLKTAQKKYGSASAYFAGSSDKLTYSGTPFAFDAGDFTLEAWVYQTTDPASGGVVISVETSAGTNGVTFYLRHSNGGWKPRVRNATTGTGGNGSNVYALNAWHHVALVRNGSNYKLYVDGALEVTLAASTHTISQIVVGHLTDMNSGYGFVGYIDDLRVTKGVARYTSNFTPPGALLDTAPIISGTVKVAGSGSAEKVRVYRRDTGTFLAEATAAGDGTYSLYTRYLGDIRVDFVPPSGYRPLSHTLSPP